MKRGKARACKDSILGHRAEKPLRQAASLGSPMDRFVWATIAAPAGNRVTAELLERSDRPSSNVAWPARALGAKMPAWGPRPQREGEREEKGLKAGGAAAFLLSGTVRLREREREREP
jgi:hypothetical protein